MNRTSNYFICALSLLLCGTAFCADYSRRKDNSQIDSTNSLSRQIVDADCVYENGKFIMKALPSNLPSLFTIRFTAPANYSRNEVVVVKDRELTVRTPTLQPMPDNVFTQGAVVNCSIDLDQGICFIQGIGTVNNGVAFAMVPDYTNRELINRISTNNGTWTVDRDGFVYCLCATRNMSYGGSIYINDLEVGYGIWRGVGIYPVSKGDVVRLSAAVFSNATCYYVPAKDVSASNQ